jgi:membrane protease YdiL (CAAX protease family)
MRVSEKWLASGCVRKPTTLHWVREWAEIEVEFTTITTCSAHNSHRTRRIQMSTMPISIQGRHKEDEWRLTMNTGNLGSKQSPLAFILLVFLLTIPIYFLGSVTEIELLPGLPISSLASFCPALAALILRYREAGIRGASDLMRRVTDFRRMPSPLWFSVAFLLQPSIAAVVYVLMRLFDYPLPVPEIPLLRAFILFFPIMLAALGEELGWSGYALEPLGERWNALPASLMLGAVWSIWHFILFRQAGRDFTWIFWQSLMLMASRVLNVWLYYRAGKSVAFVAITHAMLNVSWLLFPNGGSHYDPRLTSLVSLALVIVVVLKEGLGDLGRQSSGVQHKRTHRYISEGW